MTQDIQTRQVGYAPDERGRDHPPEIVYLTDAPVRARQSLRQWLAVALFAAVWIIAILEAIGVDTRAVFGIPTL